MKKTKIGIASFAHSGHARSYLNALLQMPDVEVTGIADGQVERVEAFTQQHRIPCYADYREMLDTDMDGVIICSENAHHAELTIAAALARKHVLCEKPLGLSVAEMRSMIQVCKDNEVQLMTAFPCRYLSSVAHAKAAVERREIGDIVAMKGTNRGWMPGRWFIDPTLSGGGAVIDHTVHVADLMNMIMGSPVAEVYAETGTLFHDVPVEDAGMVHMTYENGVFAVLDPSWAHTKATPRIGNVTLEIIGTKGVINVDGFAQFNEVYTDDPKHARPSFWGDQINDCMIHDFIAAIRSGGDVPITGEDGLRASAVALAAYESSRLGRPIRMEDFMR